MRLQTFLSKPPLCLPLSNCPINQPTQQPTNPEMYPSQDCLICVQEPAAAQVSDHTLTFTADAMMKNTQHFL